MPASRMLRQGDKRGSTLCRWENRVDRETARRMHEVIVEQFIASFKKAPKKLILDFDGGPPLGSE